MSDNVEVSDVSGAAPPAGAAMAAPPAMGVGMISQEEKGQATLIWVLTIFFGFIPPLIFFLIAKDKPYVYRQSVLALSLCILTAVAYLLAAVLVVVLIGLLLIPVVLVFHLVICIMGAMAANKGEEFRPPIVSNVAKMIFGA